MSEANASAVLEPPVAPATEERKSAPAKKNFFSNATMIDVIGGVSSVVTGGITAWRIIEERAYKNLSSLHIFENIKKKRRDIGEELDRKVEAGELSTPQAQASLKQAVMECEQLVDEKLDKVGYRKITDQYKILRSHQKWEVVLTAIAYGGVALGSVLLLTRGVFSKQDQQALADKNTPADIREIHR